MTEDHLIEQRRYIAASFANVELFDHQRKTP